MILRVRQKWTLSQRCQAGQVQYSPRWRQCWKETYFCRSSGNRLRGMSKKSVRINRGTIKRKPITKINNRIQHWQVSSARTSWAFLAMEAAKKNLKLAKAKTEERQRNSMVTRDHRQWIRHIMRGLALASLNCSPNGLRWTPLTWSTSAGSWRLISSLVRTALLLKVVIPLR